jgi:hypothetical protein
MEGEEYERWCGGNVPEVCGMRTSADQLSTEQIISAIGRLNLPELEQVFDHVLALQIGIAIVSQDISIFRRDLPQRRAVS